MQYSIFMVLTALGVALSCALPSALYAADTPTTKEQTNQWWGKTKAEQEINKTRALDIALAELQDPTSDEMLEKAVYYLEMLGEEAVPSLLPLMRGDKDNQRKGRENALYAAGRMGKSASAAIPTMVLSLKHPDADTRAVTARALGKMQKNAAKTTPLLINLLKDESDWVRKSAEEALKAINSDDARLALAHYHKQQQEISGN